MKKNIYMVQVNASFGKAGYLPYSVGALAAYALSSETVVKSYDIRELIWLRLPVEDNLALIENPFMVCFSTYVCNLEYNRMLARRVREKFPDCLILFGGHSVPDSASFLEEHEYADFTIFGEGEEPFLKLLLALNSGSGLEGVPSLFYRGENGDLLASSAKRTSSLSEYPSPYAMGLFDKIIADNPDVCLSTIIETSRGCPYHCSYCDWTTYQPKVRLFPLERVYADLEWIGRNRIEFCLCADANFAVSDQDSDIVDRAIDVHERTGYPQIFRATFTKNSNQTVFDLTQRLLCAGMSRGVTLALQTVSPDALKNIGRENIDIERYSKLTALCARAGIPTYCELIFGLPGETYDSFLNAFETLFEAGQHTSVLTYNCEMLINSTMGTPEYIEKYQIETVCVPFSQEHFDVLNVNVEEKSHIVVGSYSMSKQEWLKTCLFSLLLMGIHSLGLLQFFAIYLYYEKNIRYIDFYDALFKHAEQKKGGVLFDIIESTRLKLADYIAGKVPWTHYNEKFGSITWPPEEGIFLEILDRADEFYDEAESFLRSFGLEEELFLDLLAYQRAAVRSPEVKRSVISLSHDLQSYFETVFTGGYEPIAKLRNELVFRDDFPSTAFADFAREIVWFGRRLGKTVHKSAEKRLVE